jgi:hypothetical protein
MRSVRLMQVARLPSAIMMAAARRRILLPQRVSSIAGEQGDCQYGHPPLLRQDAAEILLLT